MNFTICYGLSQRISLGGWRHVWGTSRIIPVLFSPSWALCSSSLCRIFALKRTMQITIIDFAKRHGNGMIAYLEENQSNIQFMVLTQTHAKVAKKVIKKLENWTKLLAVSPPLFPSLPSFVRSSAHSNMANIMRVELIIRMFWRAGIVNLPWRWEVKTTGTLEWGLEVTARSRTRLGWITWLLKYRILSLFRFLRRMLCIMMHVNYVNIMMLFLKFVLIKIKMRK